MEELMIIAVSIAFAFVAFQFVENIKICFEDEKKKNGKKGR